MCCTKRVHNGGGVALSEALPKGRSEGVALNGTGSTKWHLVGACSPLSGTLWGRLVH